MARSIGRCQTVLETGCQLRFLADTTRTQFTSSVSNACPISSVLKHFQQRMSEALSGLAGTVCMMDDVHFYGENHEQHDERLTGVLQRLSDLGMMLNADKCVFAQTSVKFLGHVVDSQGIRPDPDKPFPSSQHLRV